MYRVLVCTLLLALGLSPASARSAGEKTTKQKPQTHASTQTRVALADTKTKPQPSLEMKSGGARPTIRAKTPPTVKFASRYAKGTIIIDTKRRRLLYVRSPSRAYIYPISVGRAGFQWTGTHKVTAKRNWPDWHPPEEMRERDPRLPVKMTGGINNPLGAKALYLGSTLYRIHGTNNARSIGRAASSGCFRMHNSHVTHLSRITRVGAKVIVKNALPSRLAKSFRKNKSKSKRLARNNRNRISSSRDRRRLRQTTRTNRSNARSTRRVGRQRPAPRKRRMAWRRSILGTN